MAAEAEIEIKKRERAKQRQGNPLPVMKKLICKELLKNPKRLLREKSETDWQQLRLQEEGTSLESERSLRLPEVMISILEVKGLTMGLKEILTI
jgi:hypothetical protein